MDGSEDAAVLAASFDPLPINVDTLVFLVSPLGPGYHWLPRSPQVSPCFGHHFLLHSLWLSQWPGHQLWAPSAAPATVQAPAPALASTPNRIWALMVTTILRNPPISGSLMGMAVQLENLFPATSLFIAAGPGSRDPEARLSPRDPTGNHQHLGVRAGANTPQYAGSTSTAGWCH